MMMHKDLLPSMEQHQIIMMLKRGQKTRDFIGTGRYDKKFAKYIPGLLELAFQAMIEDIDTKKKLLTFLAKIWNRLIFKLCQQKTIR